jgi:EAL and modified HD-GYP domain-containing signal transduction protein
LRSFPLQLLAEKIETRHEFKTCKALAFSAFQGSHFAQTEILSARIINPAQARVIELLNMVRSNAEFTDIEAALKCDVGLSIRLLRYINSIGFGLSVQVRSMRHALTVLGYRQLYRWLSLLLLTSDGDTPNAVVARTALTRGRLTEILGEGRLSGYERDNLFIVGLFSLIDLILGVPMSKALDTLGLPENIREALLYRKGVYSIFLDLAEACEDGDWRQLNALAQKIGLTARQVNEAHLSALAWSSEVAL